MRNLKLSDYSQNSTLPGTAVRVVHYADESVAIHGHEFVEVVVVQNGDGFHRINGRKLRIYPGSVFCIPPGTLHGYCDFAHLSLLNFMIGAETLAGYQEWFGGLEGFRALLSPDSLYELLMLDDLTVSKIGAAVDRITAEQQNRAPGFRIAVELALGEALLLISRKLRRLNYANVKSLKLANVFSFMEKNLAGELPLAKLAALAGMSMTNFRRSFKEETGISPIRYLLTLRLAKARELLTCSSLSLSEIAAETGFGDANYFSRQFSRLVGMTPGVYRRRDHGAVHTPGLDLREKIEVLGHLQLRKYQ